MGKLGRDAEFLSGYGAELVSSKTQRNACSLPPGTLTQVLVSLLSTLTSKTNIKNELYSGWTEFCPACSPKMINKVKLLFYSPTTMVNTSHAPAKETNRRVITS